MLKSVEYWAEEHSIISVTLLHVAVGVGFLFVVSSIALAGGTVIWAAYHVLGVM